MKLLFIIFLLSLTGCHSKPISNGKSISLFITPQNIKHLASSLHSSVSITEEGRIIHVGPGTRGEELIRVPLAGPGELDPHTSFKITMGHRPISPATDYDPDIGLDDGVTTNMFRIHDQTNNGAYSQCYLLESSPHDNRPVSRSTRQSMQYIMMFEPFHRYGACYSAIEGGYVNTGIFINQLDVSNGVDLIVKREDAPENYYFFYFSVEAM